MNFLFRFICFTVIVTVASAAVYVAQNATHPDHHGKCWIPEAEVAIEPGQKYSKIGKCVEYTCASDLSYQGATCGAVGAEPPCYVTKEDNTQLYPDCCPTVECPYDG